MYPDTNYTKKPNFVYALLPFLSGNENKVLDYIIRRTLGYQKLRDRISISQFVDGVSDKDGRKLDHGAGVGRSGVIRCINSLEKKGLILVERGIGRSKNHIFELVQWDVKGFTVVPFDNEKGFTMVPFTAIKGTTMVPTKERKNSYSRIERNIGKEKSPEADSNPAVAWLAHEERVATPA